MITGRIRHKVLLQTNHKNCNFREKRNSQAINERENGRQNTDKEDENILKTDLHGTTLSHTTSLRQAYDMT